MNPSPWESRLRVLGENFGWIQIAILAAILWTVWKILGPGAKESGFRVREADRPKPKGPSTGPDMGQSRRKVPPAPLQLPGLSLTGAPHEILGVRADATEAEIQLAYRELMKRFHPDRMGPPGSREWADAQGIAAALSQARDSLLERTRQQGR